MAANTNSPRNGENVTEEQADSNDTRLVEIGSVEGSGALEMPELTGDSSVRVQAQRVDDGAGHVELTARVGGASAVLALDADDAEQLAAKISSAAAFAGGEADE